MTWIVQSGNESGNTREIIGYMPPKKRKKPSKARLFVEVEDRGHQQNFLRWASMLVSTERLVEQIGFLRKLAIFDGTVPVGDCAMLLVYPVL